MRWRGLWYLKQHVLLRFGKKDVYLYIIIRTFLTLKTERLADSFLSYGHQIGGVTLVFSRFHVLFSKKPSLLSKAYNWSPTWWKPPVGSHWVSRDVCSIISTGSQTKDLCVGRPAINRPGWREAGCMAGCKKHLDGWICIGKFDVWLLNDLK